MKVGLLYSRIRKDEKLLLGELRERGHDVEKVDVRKQQFRVGTPPEALAACDVVLDRCLATSRSKYATTFCESYGVPVVNDPSTADVCADKAKTSVKLDAAGVPTPATTVAFDVDSAMDAIEEFGYPCVIKPVVGSWGRLLAKIESESAAEAVLEHKKTLGHYEHSVFYVQEFVEKPGRDLRVLTLDGEPVAAMARSSEHWLTNAAKGAEVTEYDIPEAVAELAREASDAVGGGLLGVDVMETGDGYTVPEVNHTVEFKALNDAVETDVPATVVDWLETKAETESADAEVSA
ncbi:[lysine-biosynthesis-protein LysW]--L-2-aminoadipate ligase [Halarchaeum rubridurum]|uniref:Lysine biosynthesis enzyme LysX n=1 Tax=Halarchaeum rubridurum TaxID=489911 RepID=A0A830G3Q9_9EURY|nr:lysine biosynthesis protein LysX [Halarchaeum rubridurum]MBP1955779.1 [lysine-biosynthesis-protein LysW]--L-2-aminoadipate ligase [Halarchaeum rubridurum]GGM74603.1 lysine biosynthesis enzyme LysX [Halarchaeum rubridurum]